MSMDHSDEVNSSCANAAADRARLVIFVGGFDPRGARHYHQMMRSESQKQAAVSGKGEYVIGSRDKWLSGREEKPIHSLWSVRQQEAAENAATDFLFFDWHDQVRANWPEGRATVFRQALGTYAAIWRLRQWLKPIHEQARFTLWALAYPIVYLALVCLLGAGLGMALGSVIASGAWVGALALFVWVFVCWGGFVLDGHIHVSWLLRILNFAHLSSNQAFPVLDARMEALAADVAKGVRENRWREVVVVGFSVGTVQAVKLISILRQRMAIDQVGATSSMLASPPYGNLLSLVTLGNCIPLFGLFPGAAALRRTLRELAQDEAVYWADISSPSDSVCFGMCDVVGLSLREDGLCKPKASGPALKTASKIEQWGVNPQAVCSPRFHKLFHAASYRWLRRNKMRMHFQYLMAGEIAGAYDYFELLSSPGLIRDHIQKKLVR
ncbi:MAG: hypothetical protein LBJ15_14825 [Comamonas sp.]|uniref:hypothetical protein n=1 Tax=Comamonas sp. TaxID=34028 RepID=UPI002823EA70|nr:hypothetical protein [Comamonas sp.]MDR0215264.1 hypothetical protein [Comamonas sp.]